MLIFGRNIKRLDAIFTLLAITAGSILMALAITNTSDSYTASVKATSTINPKDTTVKLIPTAKKTPVKADITNASKPSARKTVMLTI